MSDASDKLARTRLAIIAHVQRKEHQHERRQRDDEAMFEAQAPEAEDNSAPRARRRTEQRRTVSGWFSYARHALGTWWRHHPAHMGVELATPALSAYAARKPVQYVAIAAAAGALVMLTRPWRLVSLTGVVVALLKSSQLSGLLMSTISGGDDGRDYRAPH